MKTAENIVINPAIDWVYVFKQKDDSLLPSRVRFTLNAKTNNWELPAAYSGCPIFATYIGVSEYIERETGKKIPLFS